MRRFLPRPVPREVLESMVEAARLAPSACNGQPWRFIAVQGEPLRGRLAAEALGGAVPNRWAASAPAFLVATAERALVTHRLAELVAGIRYHQIDTAIALEHAVLRGVELGVGKLDRLVPGEGRAPLLLGLPRGRAVVSLLAVGGVSRGRNPSHAAAGARNHPRIRRRRGKADPGRRALSGVPGVTRR